jgi:hypothetical protein
MTGVLFYSRVEKSYTLSMNHEQTGEFRVEPDPLQAQLEKKEEESNSPSLDGVEYNTADEKELSKRYSGKKSVIKKLIGIKNVQRVEQKEAITDGKENYCEYFGGWGYSLDDKRKRLEEIARWITNERQELIKSKKVMDRVDINVMAWINKYSRTIENLRRLYASIDMDFPIDDYEKLKIVQAKKGFKRALERLQKDIAENNIIIDKDFYSVRERLQDLEGLSELAGLEEPIPKVRELIDLYLKETRTISVSEISAKYGVAVVHVINNIGRFKGDGVGENNQGLDSHTIRGMGFKDFFHILTEKKPMVAASTVRPNYQDRLFTHQDVVGVVFKEGKVFDAGSNTITSVGLADGTRFRHSFPGSSDPIEKRVERAVNKVYNKNLDYNELIVGGDYQIGGLFIYPESMPELIKEVAQTAVKNNLSFYLLEEGKGLRQINPQDYI